MTHKEYLKLINPKKKRRPKSLSLDKYRCQRATTFDGSIFIYFLDKEISKSKARKLAKWLLRAADYLESQNERR